MWIHFTIMKSDQVSLPGGYAGSDSQSLSWFVTDKRRKTDLGKRTFGQNLPVESHENPRQTPREVSAGVRSTAADTRPTMVWGWRLIQTSLWAAHTWLHFLNLFVIHPMQRLWSHVNSRVVKQLERHPFYCSSFCASFFWFCFPQTVSPSSPANSPNSQLLLFWKGTFLDVIKLLLGKQMLWEAQHVDGVTELRVLLGRKAES